jgi:hypothetical protein
MHNTRTGGPDTGFRFNPIAQFLTEWCQSFPDFMWHNPAETVLCTPRRGVLNVWQCPNFF